MTRVTPSSDHDSEAATSDPTQGRPKRRPAEPKLYIHFLPEGKGGPKVDKGSVPLEVDFEAHIEERSDCDPGLFRIEKKRSGEFSGEVLFYEKNSPSDSDAAEDEFEEPEDEVGASSASEIARVVSATLDARDRRLRAGQSDPMDQFRQMRTLLKEEREEMQRQLRESESSSQPRDSLAEFERFIELQKKLQPEPATREESELSATDRAQLMLMKETGIIPEFMRNVRQVLRAPEAAAEPEGFIEKILAFAKDALPYVGPTAGPMLGQKIGELVSHVDVAALAQKMNAQSAGAPGPTTTTAASDPRALGFGRIMRRIAIDLMDGVGPDVAVGLSVQFIQTFPDVRPQVEQLLSATPSDAARFVSSQVGQDLNALPHCEKWISEYQSQLRSALRTSAAATPPLASGAGESEGEELLTLQDVLGFIKQQIIENHNVTDSASSVIQLLAEQPDLAPAIRQMFEQSNSDLVSLLSQATQTDLSIIANAESFIEKLKVAITERLRVPVSTSTNGRKPDARVTVEANA